MAKRVTQLPVHDINFGQERLTRIKPEGAIPYNFNKPKEVANDLDISSGSMKRYNDAKKLRGNQQF